MARLILRWSQLRFGGVAMVLAIVDPLHHFRLLLKRAMRFWFGVPNSTVTAKFSSEAAQVETL
ncbi:hypothetical protein PanWU01x14_172750 [Parasponia andersonii]|uniref:Uncharacterized protein n=1 Tax=Parasponia andersonii TaxID=3476 RepID=A0A2P5C987_PARAD|nr:hypothetical protein PanWU01x14_172750 [Parasponia andersonii]